MPKQVKPFIFPFLSSCLVLFGGLVNPLFAQPPQYKMQVYIANYGEVAISQMVEYKIPASVILAQAIFESRCGGSELAKKSNNHFGIKCHLEWEGDTIVKTDDTLNECFRKYPSIEESYTDHSKFLTTRSRYASLFTLPINDYQAWCIGLKNAGYATYDTYAEELINLIEQTGLYKLDQIQPVKSGIRLKDPPDELKTSRLNTKHFSLEHFAENGLLWLDETNCHIRSIDLILRTASGATKPFSKK